MAKFMGKEESLKISKIVAEKIKSKKFIVKANLKITSTSPEGVLIIRKALSTKYSKVNYLGAPNYMLSVEDKDYKSANKKLDSEIEAIEEYIRKQPNTKIEVEKE